MFWSMRIMLFVTLVVVVSVNQSSAAKKKAREGSSDRKWPLNPHLQRSTSPHKRNGNPVYDPKVSWNYFLNAAGKNERKGKKIKIQQRKRMNDLNRSFSLQRPAAMLPGPRGPAGPPGPKGANVTAEEMFEEFRSMINEITKQKILLAADPRCTELCVSSLGENDTKPVDRWPKISEDHELFVPKIVTSFMWDLKKYIMIPKQAKVELDVFESATKPGSFSRDSGNSNPVSGRFVATRTGFYTFNARMHIRLPEDQRNERIQRSDLFAVQICIDSSFKKKTYLETVSGLGPGEVMTITVNGLLHLKINEYVSIFVDNASNFDLLCLDGSQFTGYLVGV